MIHSFFSDIVRITASVKISHHFPACEAATHDLTVSTEFSNKTHSSAQSVRSVCILLIQRSDSNSLKIFLRLGCALDPFGTEKESHIAAPGV